MRNAQTKLQKARDEEHDEKQVALEDLHVAEAELHKAKIANEGPDVINVMKEQVAAKKAAWKKAMAVTRPRSASKESPYAAAKAALKKANEDLREAINDGMDEEFIEMYQKKVEKRKAALKRALGASDNNFMAGNGEHHDEKSPESDDDTTAGGAGAPDGTLFNNDRSMGSKVGQTSLPPLDPAGQPSQLPLSNMLAPKGAAAEPDPESNPLEA